MNATLHTKFGTAKLGDDGYYKITSSGEGNHNKFLHRLIYEDFWGVKLIPQIYIHHKDGNKSNNCILNLEAMLGSTHSKLHNLGKTVSEETRKKISKAHKGKNNPFYGKSLSDEHKNKISNSLKNRVITEEHRLKIRKGNLGKHSIKNTTGLYNVSKPYDTNCKQGYFWKYQYYDETGKRWDISRVDLLKLKKEVLSNNLPWKIIDKDKVMNICKTTNYEMEDLE